MKEIEKILSERVCMRDVELWSSQRDPQLVDLVIERGVLREIRPIEDGAQSRTAYDPAVEEISLHGLSLLPCGVDPQVHLRVPGQSQKETPETGLKAARKGGIGALLTMANTKPVIDSPESLAVARAELGAWEQKTGVKVLWSSAVTKGLLGNELVDFRAMAAAGVSAFTDDGLGVMRPELMLEAFRQLGELGLPLLQHAEMAGHKGVLAAGATQQKIGAPLYPREPEWEMVARDIALLKQAPKCRYHVLHVSCRETLDLIQKAKAQGLQVSGEVTPHHLFFNSMDIVEGNTAFKMNPPLRDPEDQTALWEALSDGRLSFVATDHAPHEARMKGSDFTTAAFGTTGLETALRVLIDGFQKGKLTARRLVQVFSAEPARFLGIESEFGDLAIGKPFRAIAVDIGKRPSTVQASELASLSQNNCFIGSKLPGKIVWNFSQQQAVRWS